MALSAAVDGTYRGRLASRAIRDQKHRQDGEGLADEVGGQLQGRGHAHDIPAVVGVDYISDCSGSQVLFSQGRARRWLS